MTDLTGRNSKSPHHIRIMAEVHDDTCEMKRRGEWILISIDEALDRHSDKVMRCPACHGRVKAHHASNNGMRAYFEHYDAHPGCPRGSSYIGTPSPHPKAQ